MHVIMCVPPTLNPDGIDTQWRFTDAHPVESSGWGFNFRGSGRKNGKKTDLRLDGHRLVIPSFITNGILLRIYTPLCS